MPFSFVVEDGSMIAGSNSYCTVDFADTYLTANIHVGPQWLALDTPSKQYLLVWASRYLDQRATWNGYPTDEWLANPTLTNLVATWASPPDPTTVTPQSMRWPRAGVCDIDGHPIAYNVIPNALQEAVCEMARYLIASDRSLERPQDGLSELKIDVMTIKFKDYTLPIVPNEIAYIIRGLGTISSGRTNFSKIRKV